MTGLLKLLSFQTKIPFFSPWLLLFDANKVTVLGLPESPYFLEVSDPKQINLDILTTRDNFSSTNENFVGPAHFSNSVQGLKQMIIKQ